MVTLHWLLDKHPNDQEQFLWDMAELVQQQVRNKLWLLSPTLHGHCLESMTGYILYFKASCIVYSFNFLNRASIVYM